jgi:uncharacterized membrane protein YqgA involved in biofilm formation
MAFLGTIVNFLAVLVCGLLGLLVKRGVPKRISDGILSAMAAVVIFIGIDGALEPAPSLPEGALLSAGLVKILVMIISLALGTFIGELIDIDKWVNRLGQLLESKLVKDGEKGNFAKAFVSCSLLFCVGAMTVNGAFADAVGKPDILIAKSVIDGIVCFVMASSLGIGCAASSVFVLVYQGLLTVVGLLLAGSLSPEIISYMSVTGSLIILLIGVDMLGVVKIKTANMIPAIFLPALVSPLILAIIS